MDNNEMNNNNVGATSSDVNTTANSQTSDSAQDATYTTGDYTSYADVTPTAYTYSPVEEEPKKGMAIAALVLGIVSLIAWCLPLLGYPVSIAGLILGILGMKKSVKGMSVAGTIMSGVGLVITIINSIAGVALMMSNMSN